MFNFGDKSVSRPSAWGDRRTSETSARSGLNKWGDSSRSGAYSAQQQWEDRRTSGAYPAPQRWEDRRTPGAYPAPRQWEDRRRPGAYLASRQWKDSSRSETSAPEHYHRSSRAYQMPSDIRELLASLNFQDLPIGRVQSEINSLVRNNTTVFGLATSTGSGKTIAGPIMIAQTLNQMGLFTNIIVSIPLIEAATSAYKYCREKYTGLESLFGLRAGNESSPNFHTSQIQYVTTRSAINLLIKLARQEPSRCPSTTVIIDEWHIKSTTNCVITRLADEMLRCNYSLNVALFSATPSPVDKQLTHLASADEINLMQTCFPIETRFTKAFITTSECEETHEKLVTVDYVGLYNAVIELLYEHDHTTGSMLVFVSGQEDINAIQALIKTKKDRGYELSHPIHIFTSKTSDREKRLVTDGHPKIILSTNAGETGVTFPNMRFVFDLSLCKSNKMITGRQSLDVSVISKAASIQRKGRTGRQCEGVHYIMTSKEEYDKFDEHDIVEKISELDSWILDFLGCKINIAKVLGISDEEYAEMIEKMMFRGFIESSKDGYKVTRKGEMSKAIKFSDDKTRDKLFSIIDEMGRSDTTVNNLRKMIMIIILASIDTSTSESVFFIPSSVKPKDRNEYYLRNFRRFVSNDIITMVLIFATMISECQGVLANDVNFERTFGDWCRDSSISSRFLKNVFMKVVACSQVFFPDGFKGLSGSYSDWDSIIRLCNDSEYIPTITETLVAHFPENVYTAVSDNKYCNSEITAKVPSNGLHATTYTCSRTIIAFTCFFSSVLGKSRTPLLGMILPLEEFQTSRDNSEYDSDSASVISDLTDDC